MDVLQIKILKWKFVGKRNFKVMVNRNDKRKF